MEWRKEGRCAVIHVPANIKMLHSAHSLFGMMLRSWLNE
ncbi:MAG: hypothetical protein OJF50_001006 [Nitrospira sp.]|nr:hypothetical protein [Nitrospira sp.]